MRTRLEQADWTQLLSQVWESQAAVFAASRILGELRRWCYVGEGTC